MTTDRQNRRDELVDEMMKRSGNSFPVMYQALKKAAAKGGDARKMDRETVFRAIEEVKRASAGHLVRK